MNKKHNRPAKALSYSSTISIGIKQICLGQPVAESSVCAMLRWALPAALLATAPGHGVPVGRGWIQVNFYFFTHKNLHL
ncbi:hypothetical protein IX84_03875 [Phaeodactylibacter xiamenensis]|uniref:Uncharacterized protein n=1 Tax=Phaeodactylibacter xiamenensis TaxID=1524460 RepID=A0A098SD74_9BACT|nr:hypothetical protein IX84_03875 [Phaeodactylibacter xiamenensis]